MGDAVELKKLLQVGKLEGWGRVPVFVGLFFVPA